MEVGGTQLTFTLFSYFSNFGDGSGREKAERVVAIILATNSGETESGRVELSQWSGGPRSSSGSASTWSPSAKTAPLRLACVAK